MSMTRWFVVASGAAMVLASACTTDNVGSGEGEATSCEGASFDSGGHCRVNGRFAKKSCCELATPSARRTLEAYTCPSGDAPIPVALFDADSTLRISRSGSPSANGPEDVYVRPFAARTIAELNQQGYLVAVVSNQGGVGAGYVEYAVAEGALAFTANQLHELGGKIDYFDFAENKDDNRKPNTGMPERLDGMLKDKCDRGIDWEASFMVGDAGYKQGVDGPHPDGRPADDFSNSDRGLAENLGIAFHEPTDYFGWRTWETYNIHDLGDLEGLLEAMSKEAKDLEQSDQDWERHEMLVQEVEDIRRVNDLQE
jgi:DNA 3'-phosphatase